MEREIRLSSFEFKALASETRANIIRLLKQRNHTLTEISKKLKLAAPTIKQHLGILAEAELVQELDEGRKWKYYTLTRKSRNIFSAETPVNVLIVLGVSVVALVGLLYSFVSRFGVGVMPAASKGQTFLGQAEDSLVAGAVPAVAKEAARTASEDAVWAGVQAASAQPEMIAMLLAIVAFAVIAGYLIAKAR